VVGAVQYRENDLPCCAAKRMGRSAGFVEGISASSWRWRARAQWKRADQRQAFASGAVGLAWRVGRIGNVATRQAPPGVRFDRTRRCASHHRFTAIRQLYLLSIDFMWAEPAGLPCYRDREPIELQFGRSGSALGSQSANDQIRIAAAPQRFRSTSPGQAACLRPSVESALKPNWD
jgi:hypothetical protein